MPLANLDTHAIGWSALIQEECYFDAPLSTRVSHHITFLKIAVFMKYFPFYFFKLLPYRIRFQLNADAHTVRILRTNNSAIVHFFQKSEKLRSDLHMQQARACLKRQNQMKSFRKYLAYITILNTCMYVFIFMVPCIVTLY